MPAAERQQLADSLGAGGAQVGGQVGDAVNQAFVYALNDGLRIGAAVAVARRAARLAADRRPRRGPGRGRRDGRRPPRRGRSGAGRGRLAQPLSGAAASFGGAGCRSSTPSISTRSARCTSAGSSSGSTSTRPATPSSTRSASCWASRTSRSRTAKEFGQRPKIDDYGERVLIVFYGAHDDRRSVGGPRPRLRQGGRDRPPRACAHLWEARERAADAHVRTEQDLVYRVLDALARLAARARRPLRGGGRAPRGDRLRAAQAGRPPAHERAALRALPPAAGRVPQRDMLARGGDADREPARPRARRRAPSVPRRPRRPRARPPTRSPTCASCWPRPSTCSSTRWPAA